MIFANTFQGRSVFVTGHTGFKGSWLCLWLARLGAQVTGYALAPRTSPNNFSLSQVRPLLANHYEADIRDCQAITQAMKATQPDIVLHLAAETVVRRSFRIPRETFDINVTGTASVLDAVRQLDRQCVVVAVTSDKCYANHDQVWGYRENDPLGEQEPYGASKAAAEILINAYRHSYFPPDKLAQHGVKLASARAGNVIGGGDWTEDALIVDIVQALSEGVKSTFAIHVHCDHGNTCCRRSMVIFRWLRSYWNRMNLVSAAVGTSARCLATNCRCRKLLSDF